MIATRYMTSDRHARIVAHTFETTATELLPTTLGIATFSHRELVSDTWSAPLAVSPGLTYSTWRVLCEGHGFVFEETNSEVVAK